MNEGNKSDAQAPHSGDKGLHLRREKLCLSFALKSLKNVRFKHLFEPTPNVDYRFRHVKRFKEPQYDTSRYNNSPLVYLTRLINNYFEAKAT